MLLKCFNLNVEILQVLVNIYMMELWVLPM